MSDNIDANNRTIDFRYSPGLIWTCIGRPDDLYKTIVRGDGALLYEFDGLNSNPFARTLEFGIQTDQEPIEIRQFNDDPGNSIVVTVVQYPKATLTMRTFGHMHDGDRRTDVVLWKIEATEGGRDFLTALRVAPNATGRRFYLDKGNEANEGIEKKYGACVRIAWLKEVTGASLDKRDRSDDPVAFVSSPQRLSGEFGFGAGATTLLGTNAFLLNSGDSVEGAIIIPLNHDVIGDFNYAWAKDTLENERLFWKEYPVQPLRLEVPDDTVMEMLAACGRNILQAREIKGGLSEFQVGATVYRGLWVVDGHFLLEAAAYLGLGEDARHGIEALLRRVRPDGSIAEMPKHEKETAISIATLVRQTELSGDWELLRSRWNIVRNAVAYIRTRREAARQLPPDNPGRDLWPPAYADGGLGGERPEYTSVVWTLVGLKEAARAASILGAEDDARTIRADFDSLMADFRRCAKRDMQSTSTGTRYLPMRIPGGSSDHIHVPEFEGQVAPWRRVNPGTATWALCHAIYPGEVFAPDDEVVKNLLALYDEIDDEEGIPAETGWLPYQAVWNYNAGFAAEAFLCAGRSDKAVDYLYAFANHAAPTRVWREEQSLKSSQHGQYVGDMPHNWASAEFIRLVRHLLVFERGATLEILPGVPLEWLAPGCNIFVEATPTRFGPVTVSVEVDHAGNGAVRVERQLDWPTLPDKVVLKLPDTFEFDEAQASSVQLLDAAVATVAFRRRGAHA